MPVYMMSCTHCGYEVTFRTEPDAKTEGVRHVLQFPAHGIKVTPSEDVLIRELLQDVRQSTPDEAGRRRLREVYLRALTALKEGVSKDLQDELDTLTLPLGPSPSESEIRLAQAQLVGWLEGLFQGIQAALWTQHMQARAEIEEMRRRRGPVSYTHLTLPTTPYV